MGRLLNPGLGELADRFTILQLKILHALPDRTAHFRQEQAQIQMTLERKFAGVPYANLLDALLSTNRRLWQYEDRMATFAASAIDEFQCRDIALLAVNIYITNQERNRVIGELNHLGGTFHGPEKL